MPRRCSDCGADALFSLCDDCGRRVDRRAAQLDLWFGLFEMSWPFVLIGVALAVIL